MYHKESQNIQNYPDDLQPTLYSAVRQIETMPMAALPEYL
jgi:hypothetical protein